MNFFESYRERKRYKTMQSFDELTKIIAARLNIKEKQVFETIQLIDNDCSIPFIARYRKEKTQDLDEVKLAQIRDLRQDIEELRKRAAYIKKVLIEKGVLTEGLQLELEKAETLADLEDIYLPFKTKKETKGESAKKKGLLPLAQDIFNQKNIDLHKEAEKYLLNSKELKSILDVLNGARDIICEIVNEDRIIRKELRDLFCTKAVIKTKVVSKKEQEASNFKDYFNFQEPIKKIVSHRFLAVFRGEKEKLLRLKIEPDKNLSLKILKEKFVRKNKGNGYVNKILIDALEETYQRLLSKSLANEAKRIKKDEADLEAIEVFAGNLKSLLLEPPLGRKKLLAIDPGIRTGCKMTGLDQSGNLLFHDTIYLNQSEKKRLEELNKIKNYCHKYLIEIIAIGSGTYGKETQKIIDAFKIDNVKTVMVNESGASIYSASEVARKEFPDLDITFRGAVSIGRRLMDPLSELVKIDPKSIGVGQYQHDVDQKLLKRKLDDVVINVVNQVGVDLNAASSWLLAYVSGISVKVAANIISYRTKYGSFKNRMDLLKVTGIGDKVFEQSAGFLKIRDSFNSLDNSSVHPESYYLVENMAKNLNCEIKNLIGNEDLISKINPGNYINEKTGVLTINDILNELRKPGLDPREEFSFFSFQEGIDSMDDLKPGMKLPGIVTNVTKFGAFVDIGVHQDGLVHISQISEKFIENPLDFLKVSQQVFVTVIGVDTGRKRISLSMKAK